MKALKLEELPNKGKTIAEKLRRIGIKSPSDLKKVGAENAFRKLQSATPVRLPVCYHLYSLEGALRRMDWRRLPGDVKNQLLRAIGQ